MLKELFSNKQCVILIAVSCTIWHDLLLASSLNVSDKVWIGGSAIIDVIIAFTMTILVRGLYYFLSGFGVMIIPTMRR